MGLKFQYNKIAMQSLQKQLKIREKALPTLKSKEAALRVTVKKYRDEAELLNKELMLKLESLESSMPLWTEFPEGVFYLSEILLDIKKIAGVRTPELKNLEYEIENFSRFNNPTWLNFGIETLKEITVLLTKHKTVLKKVEILDYARKKTTQKVNLYEKVQIPSYTEALRKIKGYLEDVDNLEKAGQKITKQKQMKSEA